LPAPTHRGVGGWGWGTQTLLPELANAFSERVRAIVARIRRDRPTHAPLVVCKEDGDAGLRAAFLSALVEDKTDRAMSYQQFLQHLREKVLAEA
jgi:protein transport protein SEC24